MKLLKKFAALAMASVLAIASLAACGSDEDNNSKGTNSKNENNSGKQQITSFEEAIEAGSKLEDVTFEGELGIKLKGDSYLEYVTDTLGDGQIDVKLTFKGNTKGDAADAAIGIKVNDIVDADIINLVCVDEAVYVDLKGIVENLAEISKNLTGQEADVEEIFGQMPEGRYLKLTKEMLEELADSNTSGVEVNPMLSGLFAKNDTDISDKDAQKLQEIAEYFLKLVADAVKKDESKVFSSSGDTYSMHIGKDNINAVVSVLAKAVSENSDAVAAKLKELIGADAPDGENLKTLADTFEAYDVAALIGDLDFGVNVKASYVDDVFKLGADMYTNLETKGEEVRVDFSCTVSKNSSVTITAPTDVISDEDTKALMDLIKNTEKIPEDI